MAKKPKMELRVRRDALYAFCNVHLAVINMGT